MGNLALDNNLLSTISVLASRLKTTKEEIVKKAVDSYAKKIGHGNHLMEFAGMLDEDEAEEILDCIYNNRYDKELEPRA